MQLERSLPLPLTFNDHMGAAQVAQLPTALEIEDAEPVTGYRAGDVAYWAPEQSIVIFLTDGPDLAAEGLVLMGHVSVGLDDLAGCARNCAVRLVKAAAAQRVDEQHGG